MPNLKLQIGCKPTKKTLNSYHRSGRSYKSASFQLFNFFSFSTFFYSKKTSVKKDERQYADSDVGVG